MQYPRAGVRNNSLLRKLLSAVRERNYDEQQKTKRLEGALSSIRVQLKTAAQKRPPAVDAVAAGLAGRSAAARANVLNSIRQGSKNRPHLEMRMKRYAERADTEKDKFRKILYKKLCAALRRRMEILERKETVTNQIERILKPRSDYIR